MTVLRTLLLGLLLALCATQVEAASRFLVACTTTCTWDNSSTAIWSASSGGAPGSSAPTSSDNVTLDASSCVGGLTCTITVNANLSISSLTMGACTASTAGCILDFSVNNNTISLASFDNSGTGTRTLLMGTSPWTLSAGWTMTTVTNLTFSNAGSTINFTATSSSARTVSLGTSKTYGTINFNTNTSLGGYSIFGTTPTITALNIFGSGMVAFANGSTFNITTLAITGTSSVPVLLESASPGNTTALVVTNNATVAWTTFREIVFSGGGNITATNSLDGGRNSISGGGVLAITPPSVGGGTAPCLGCGGWLLNRDLGVANDNRPVFLNAAA